MLVSVLILQLIVVELVTERRISTEHLRVLSVPP